MGRPRRGSTPEYKDEGVKLVINTGRPVAVVPRELGIQESTLGRWVNVFKGHRDACDGVLSETERVELARLRRENSELKVDWALLKRASLFNARGSFGYEREAFALMHAEKRHFLVTRMARLLGVSRLS